MSETPNTPEALGAIKEAVMAFQTGDLPQAIELAGRAASDHPEHPVAHNVRGVFLLQNRQVEEALEAFLIATRLRPDYAEAQNNCGIALSDLLRDDLAIEHYRRAIALNEDYFEAHNNLGTSLEAVGTWEPALERFRIAVALNPDYTEARLNAAGLLRDLGRRDAAEAAYREILARESEHIEAIAGLAMIHRIEAADDPLLAQIEGLRSGAGLAPEAQARMTYVAAAAHHQLGDYETAFELWSRGAGQRKALMAYDAAAVAREFEQIKAAFQALPDPVVVETGKVAPLFILGMPRSGTTLVEQMLANHPDISAAGELDFLELLVRKSRSDARAPSAAELSAIRDNYLDRLPQFARGAAFVTDKTPANFFWIGHILSAMPEAKILHIKRDARAVCWSIFRNDFGQMGHGYPTALADLVTYWNDYKDLMAHWRTLASDRVVEIDYAALVADPEAVMRQVVARIGLDWTPKILEFTATERAVKTLSSQQVRRSIYQGSSEAWRAYEDKLAPFFADFPG